MKKKDAKIITKNSLKNNDKCDKNKKSLKNKKINRKIKYSKSKFVSDSDSDLDFDYKVEHNKIKKKIKLEQSNINFDYNCEDEHDEIKMTKKQNMELKKIHEIINKKDINEKKILESNILFELKIECIELMMILNTFEKNSEEYYKLKKKIYENMNDEVLNKITNSNHNDDIKNILYKKYEKIRGIDKNDEYYKMMDWINTALSIPTEIKKTNKSTLFDQICDISKKMNEKMYGLHYIKEKILETYASVMINNIGHNKCIALVGPPGVGKTSFAKCIADALELPFEHISLGGIKDSSYIMGHGSTYVGSKTGIIIDSLIKMKYTNGVLLLDEFDKISNSSDGSEIYSSMLHILDYTQNNKFRDIYLSEIEIDLSKLLIIIAMNDESKLNNALTDRLSVIKINGYTNYEKKDIASNFIIKKIMKRTNLNEEDIIIDDNIIYYIINKYASKENGVRELERCFSIIFEKINILKIIENKQCDIILSYKIKNFKYPFKLTHNIVDMLLEKNI